ncbi:MAG: acetyl-CoA carboxylase biotin carboxyl carrier protein subunit [bacterium]
MDKSKIGKLQVKKYLTYINNQELKNDVEMHDDGEASLNGKLYNYEYKFIGDNVLILRVANKNYFLTAEYNEDNESVKINYDSQQYTVICRSELDQLLDNLTSNKSKSRFKKEIKSPMPGIIKSLNVKPGQHVKKDDVMLVLEAMKMENEIKAHEDCVIRNVNINVTSSVEKNELLITLE